MEVLEAAPREESRPGKADHHPEPRVAVLPVTAASKRTQGVHGPRDRAPKEVVVGAHTFSLVEGNTDGPCGRVRRSCRGLRPGHGHMGCPGTWEIPASRPAKVRVRRSGEPGQADRCGAGTTVAAPHRDERGPTTGEPAAEGN